MATAGGDQFALAYTLLTLPVLLLIAFSREIDRTFNLYLLLVPLLLVPVVVLFTILLAAFASSLVQRRWRHALSALLAPALAAAPLMLCFALGVTPERVWIQFERGNFERKVARVEQQDGVPRLIAFDHGSVGGAGSASVEFTLVYDESDEIELPPPQRSAAWQERAGREERLRSVVTGQDNPTVRPPGGHFYQLAQTY